MSNEVRITISLDCEDEIGSRVSDILRDVAAAFGTGVETIEQLLVDLINRRGIDSVILINSPPATGTDYSVRVAVPYDEIRQGLTSAANERLVSHNQPAIAVA